MYFFAHLFTGVLIGLGLFYLTNDRRLVPVCVAGSLIPDLLDKTLVFLVPGLFESTRTIGHTLLLAAVFVIAALILWYRCGSIAGIASAGTVLVHHLLDLMWTQPATWFFPLHGTFPLVPVTGGFLQFFWIELTNPSEWVFALASCIIVLSGRAGLPGFLPSLPSVRSITLMNLCIAGLLGITGAWLILTGMDTVSGTVPALYPGPDKTLAAGLVALSGAIILVLISGQKGAVCR
jgi:hypothetical protein